MSETESVYFADRVGLRIAGVWAKERSADTCSAAFNSCIEWGGEIVADARPLGPDSWVSSSASPRIGETRAIRVSSPFSAAYEQPFDALFMPSRSREHGWVEHPEEIAASSFVRASLKRVVRLQGDCAWLEIDVRDTIPIDEIRRRVPERREVPEDVAKYFGFASEVPFDIATYSYYTVYQWNFEGDLGLDLLVSTEEGVSRLLCSAEWSAGRDEACCCNIVLSDRTVSLLEALRSERS